jgi:hypothetical protein
MKVKFLHESKIRIKINRYCGDGCCSWPEWVDSEAFKDEEYVVDDEVDVTGLVFNKDYIIIEYP